MKKHGGKRNGAGRKPATDKKQTVVLYIEASIIKNLGGIENAKQKLYNFAKIEAGGEIIKTENDAETLIKCDGKCNMHFVSGFSIADINDAPMFTHTKQFRDHFDYIKSEFVRLFNYR